VAETNFNLLKDLLHELFEYRDGYLFRKKIYNFAQKLGEQVGKPTKDGRSCVFVNGKQYGTHQLIFVMHYGCLLYTSPSPRDATLSRMPSSA